jgi:hypothetical protein
MLYANTSHVYVCVGTASLDLINNLDSSFLDYFPLHKYERSFRSRSVSRFFAGLFVKVLSLVFVWVFSGFLRFSCGSRTTGKPKQNPEITTRKQKEKDGETKRNQGKPGKRKTTSPPQLAIQRRAAPSRCQSLPRVFSNPPFWVRSWPALSAFVQPPSSSSIDIIRHVTWYSRRSVLLYSAGVIHSLDLSNGSLAHSANHGRANVAACGL